MVRQIVGDSDALREQALLRMYAAISQDTKLAQLDARSDHLSGFSCVLEAGLPRFIKAVSAVILRTDRGTALLVFPTVSSQYGRRKLTYFRLAWMFAKPPYVPFWNGTIKCCR